MKIYLMRHGEASFKASNDDDRELTENGCAKIRFNIDQKKMELADVKIFLSSPILRAKQTAELAAMVLNRSDNIEDVRWLIHESTPLRSIACLSQYSAESVMLFTHQPLASRFIEILCDLELGYISMNTASIVAMEVDPVAAGFGKVLWQLS